MLNTLIGYRLRRATKAVYSHIDRALADTGVRQMQFGLMAILDETPGIRQGEAGKHLQVQRANMVALVEELVVSGLVDRRTAGDDRRALSLRLTEKGKRTYRRCLQRIQELEEKLFADFAEDDRKQLLSLLVRIAECDLDSATRNYHDVTSAPKRK
jgi:DNA-binding MarR family transcriptional regulator